MSKNEPKGVRGPRGPHAANAASGGQRPAPRTGQPGGRNAVERASLPLLTAVSRVPRWLVVVIMATLLFLGLVQTGALAWLGALMLLVVAAFLGWLLLLAWPALPAGSRATRLVVVLALIGIAVFKAMGRF